MSQGEMTPISYPGGNTPKKQADLCPFSVLVLSLMCFSQYVIFRKSTFNFLFSFSFFGGSQGLAAARQVLHHLSLTSSPQFFLIK
jgi:uncharacterized membrane protein YsdA (DUF1294 family)